METEQHTGVLESLFDRTTDYLETRMELAKLKAARKSSELASGLVSKVILAVFMLVFIMVLNIALGLWLGELLHKTYFGFFALSGFYLILGVIIYAGRDKWLKMPIANAIIKKIHA